MAIRVHNIGGYISKNYLLETPKGWIAIDTGYPGGGAKFLKRLAGLCRPEELQYIFLTHAHHDHAGFLRRCSGKSPRRRRCIRPALPPWRRGKTRGPRAAAAPPGWGRCSALSKNRSPSRPSIWGAGPSWCKRKGTSLSGRWACPWILYSCPATQRIPSVFFCRKPDSSFAATRP